ncbi:hypothetical protein LUZ61_015186 [Rhynchospora tenuis]|uniref:Glycosyltransferase 61 catalytic domain-containing protein n=1 Tax=Rhynchospora tenuis TaxID=198213 RepID=A0AAD5WCG4_9POAL|nr:hypothetical protein LUZ61_015186 [Rhynchospora tenuis]
MGSSKGSAKEIWLPIFTKRSWFILLLIIGSFLSLAVLDSSSQDFIFRTLNYYTNQNTEDASPIQPICDFSDIRSDICNMTGDIRTQGKDIATVFFVPPPDKLFLEEQQWNFSPYPHKDLCPTKNVTVKHLRGPQNAPACTIQSSTIPAFLFPLAGLTGNPWHDFTDILIPLFLASKPLNGEVQFVIIDYRQWFLDKYNLIFKDITRYEVINLDEDNEVRCYSHLMVGLPNHKDFGIDPDRAFDRFDMFKFRMYIRSIFSLPADVDIPHKMDPRPDKKPKLMLFHRSGIRHFLNEPEVVEVVEKNGYELVLIEPQRDDNLTEFAKLVDSCDVLMGVHGAALTNILFLRTNALMLQIIPYGHIEYYADLFYGRQAIEMKLRKIDYSISAEESSLLEKYGWDHPVIKDPDGVNARGWRDRKRYYWYEQDVRLNVTRFEPVLVKALELLKE